MYNIYKYNKNNDKWGSVCDCTLFTLFFGPQVFSVIKFVLPTMVKFFMKIIMLLALVLYRILLSAAILYHATESVIIVPCNNECLCLYMCKVY